MGVKGQFLRRRGRAACALCYRVDFGEEATLLGASSCGFAILVSFLRGMKAPGGRCYMRGRFVEPFLVIQCGLHGDHRAGIEEKGGFWAVKAWL